jgi:two-component system, NarL family, sensor histidine kinase DevS
VVASFAAQAGVALELAASRAEAERLSVLEDRDRIAQDLHDLVIQRLYATGMSLQGTMPMISMPEVASRITDAVDAMDETIKEIRSTIFQLQARGVATGPDLRGEIVALVDDMTDMLGFAPSLRLGAGLGGDISPEVADQVLAARSAVQRGQARERQPGGRDRRRGFRRDADRPGHRQRDRNPGGGAGAAGCATWPAGPRSSAAS